MLTCGDDVLSCVCLFQVKLIRLVGMMLVVFVRVELVEHLYDVMWSTVGTGILGMMVCIILVY